MRPCAWTLVMIAAMPRHIFGPHRFRVGAINLARRISEAKDALVYLA